MLPFASPRRQRRSTLVSHHAKPRCVRIIPLLCIRKCSDRVCIYSPIVQRRVRHCSLQLHHCRFVLSHICLCRIVSIVRVVTCALTHICLCRIVLILRVFASVVLSQYCVSSCAVACSPLRLLTLDDGRGVYAFRPSVGDDDDHARRAGSSHGCLASART